MAVVFLFDFVGTPRTITTSPEKVLPKQRLQFTIVFLFSLQYEKFSAAETSLQPADGRAV